MPKLMMCDDCEKETNKLYAVGRSMVCRPCFLIHRTAQMFAQLGANEHERDNDR